jgi:hypothetical protein
MRKTSENLEYRIDCKNTDFLVWSGKYCRNCWNCSRTSFPLPQHQNCIFHFLSMCLPLFAGGSNFSRVCQQMVVTSDIMYSGVFF